jgi:fimbrial isopeptide formation D2 family protein
MKKVLVFLSVFALLLNLAPGFVLSANARDNHDENHHGTLTLRKVVEGGSAKPDQWSFHVSPEINGHDTFNIPDGKDHVDIDDVHDGQYAITEIGGDPEYKFNSGNGGNCVFDGSTATATIDSDNEHNHDASCDFHNRKEEEKKTGEIEITKHVVPDNDSQWSFSIVGEKTYNVNDISDDETSNEVKAEEGTYSVTETSGTESIDHYSTSYICHEGRKEIASGNGRTIEGLEIDHKDQIHCEFTNTLLTGSITVQKYNDRNSNGERDESEETLIDWQFNLGELSETRNEDGQAVFENLSPDEYWLSEVGQEGWQQTDIDCLNQDEFRNEKNFSVNYGKEGSEEINLHGDENVFCQVGNHYTNPNLKIEKWNNSMTTSNIGDTVTYTLKVTAENNPVNDVKVSDTLPKDFVYSAGAFNVISSTDGDISGTIAPAPAYANNVENWQLGNMAKDEIITINYNAKIGENAPAGINRDNAFTSGISLLSVPVIGNAGTVGQIDASFVGTRVVVAAALAPVTYQLVTHQQTVTLASLPKTGSTPWPILVLSFIITSLLFIAGRSKSKLGIVTLGTLLIVFVAMIPTASMAASNLNVQANSITSPTGQSAPKIDYVVQDLQSRNGISVSCMKKGPSDAVFNIFQTANYNASGSGSCDLSASPFTTAGNYDIKIFASVGADVAQQVATINYISGMPGTPTNYSKNLTACNAAISFKTSADGGKTTGVEVYRSDSKTITTTVANRVDDIAVGSDTTVNRSYASPDCSKPYFFALRAYDAAKNYSALIGDEEFNITYVQGGTTISSSTAATAGNAAAGTAATGTTGAAETTPVTTPPTTTGEVKAATTEEPGNVKGEETTSDKKKISVWYWIIGGLVVIGAGYWVARRYFMGGDDAFSANDVEVKVRDKATPKKKK